MASGIIRQRSKGSWSIVLSLGTDPATGERIRKWITVKGTKTQARDHMNTILGDFNRGIVPATGKETVRSWLERWLRDVVAKRNRPRTVAGYKSIIDYHILPKLGNIPLAKLTSKDVDELTAAIMANGRTANTALHVFTTLRKALTDGERRGLVGRNVCRLADPPKVEAYRVDAPEISDVQRVISEARDTPSGPVVEFMALTGVRRGEAIALRWQNVDLERGVCMITESAVRITKQKQIVQPTKSSAGRRGVALDEITVVFLRDHQARQLDYAFKMYPAYIDNGYVFPGARGQMADLDRLSHDFKAIAKRAGYPKMRLHDLRHAHASGLFKAGAHPKVVQERLGHASAAFTMQVYGHVAAGLQAEAAGAFSKLLAARSGSF